MRRYSLRSLLCLVATVAIVLGANGYSLLLALGLAVLFLSAIPEVLALLPRFTAGARRTGR